MSTSNSIQQKLRAAGWTGRETAKKAVYFVVTGFFALVYLFPFYWLFMIATQWPTRGLYGSAPTLYPETFSLYNFVRIWYSAPVDTYFQVSVIVALIVILTQIFFCSITAYALTFDFYGRKIVWLSLVLAMLIPFQVIFLPDYLITSTLGLVNTYPGLAIVLLVSVLNILILYNAFDSIPDSIAESARCDGASDAYILFGIYWPLSKPALATVTILSFVWSWNNYLWPLMVSRTADRTPLPLGLANYQSDLASDFALQYAFAIVVLIPILIVFLLLQNQFIKSVVTSSLKQ
jgi:ABC-type glycerol-3-phosphate transport system permease component